jgi:hypothetical protein
MLQMPVLRWGAPYTSMEVDEVVHFSTGEPIARVSRANGGLVQRDARKAQQAGQAVVRRVIKPVTTRIAPYARRAWAAVATAWRTTFRPFLKSWGIVFAGTTWALALMVAPAPTLLATGAAGLAFLGLAKGVEKLQAASSKLARVALGVLEFGVQLVRTLFYTATAAMVLLTAAVSLPLLLVYVTDLAMAHFTGVRTVSRLAPAIEMATASASAAPVASETVFEKVHTRVRSRHERQEDLEVPTVIRRRAAQQRQRIEVVSPLEATEVMSDYGPADPRPSSPAHAAELGLIAPDPALSSSRAKSKALRAVGAEEMFDMPCCEACGTIEEGIRVRSASVPFATAGNIGAVEEAERPMLCSECHAAECEDIALALTGVSLKARNVDVRLNDRGLATLPQLELSREHTDTLYWTTTATAWWRDRKGDNHERAWSCFHSGKVVATVTFAHRNRTFVATVRGKVIGSQRTLGAAKALANDALMDERNAVATFVEAIGGVLEAGEHPADLARQGG